MNYALAQEQRIGMRDSNQDYVLHDATEQALLLVVADGMGGYYGGELAAEIAAGSICHSFGVEARPRIAQPEVFLERAFARAHRAIRGYADEQQLPEVPRTVMVACVVQDGRAWWNHVGDSRLYLNQLGVWNLDETSDYLVNTTIGLAFPLLWGFEAAAEVLLEYDAGAVEGVEKLDETYALRLGYTW